MQLERNIGNSITYIESTSGIHSTDHESIRTVSTISSLKFGTGEELYTVETLKLIGAHPFSKSTRLRKIQSGDYPAPIKLSSQMNVWTGKSIREWLVNPSTYKARVSANGGAK